MEGNFLHNAISPPIFFPIRKEKNGRPGQKTPSPSLFPLPFHPNQTQHKCHLLCSYFKKLAAVDMKDFRPISLVGGGGVSKIIT